MSEVPEPLGQALTEPWVAFVNINDRDGIGDPRTPQPETNVQTLYLVNPRTGQRVPVLNMPSSTDERVYWAPTGERVAYLLSTTDTPERNGLYVFDLTIGVSSRILRLNDFNQRGFFNPPRWSPDGTGLALAVANEYDVDIYVMNADGTDLRAVAPSGGYDLWPAWSPDGRYLAFVSDRAECPSWRPGDGCFEERPNGPAGGHLYVVDLVSGEVRQLSDQPISEPPYWVNAGTIGFVTGNSVAGDDFRLLWLADLATGVVRQVSLQGQTGVSYYLAESWRMDAGRVIFQRAADVTDIVVMDDSGQLVASTDRFNFVRFAMQAAWSPDGTRVAFAGRRGQCPYGLVVMTADLEPISVANPPPTVCDPIFSPDGNWIAYSGINPRIDGRLDLYIANANGYSAVNHSASLRGQIRVLGWVGAVGTP